MNTLPNHNPSASSSGQQTRLFTGAPRKADSYIREHSTPSDFSQRTPAAKDLLNIYMNKYASILPFSGAQSIQSVRVGASFNGDAQTQQTQQTTQPQADQVPLSDLTKLLEELNITLEGIDKPLPVTANGTAPAVSSADLGEYQKIIDSLLKMSKPRSNAATVDLVNSSSALQPMINNEEDVALDESKFSPKSLERIRRLQTLDRDMKLMAQQKMIDENNEKRKKLQTALNRTLELASPENGISRENLQGLVKEMSNVPLMERETQNGFIEYVSATAGYMDDAANLARVSASALEKSVQEAVAQKEKNEKQRKLIGSLTDTLKKVISEETARRDQLPYRPSVVVGASYDDMSESRDPKRQKQLPTPNRNAAATHQSQNSLPNPADLNKAGKAAMYALLRTSPNAPPGWIASTVNMWQTMGERYSGVVNTGLTIGTNDVLNDMYVRAKSSKGYN